MFGTVARAHIKPENRDAFVEVMRRQERDDQNTTGFVAGHIMFPENRENEVILVVFFEDAASYWKNADDPEQDKRYREFRALLEDAPEWSDGEWLSSTEAEA